MRTNKMLGLAVLAMLSASALMGSASASAEIVKKTVGCKVNEEPCAAENIYAKGTKAKGQLTVETEVLLETNIVNVICKKGAAEGESLEEKGSVAPMGGGAYSVLGTATVATLSECKTSGGANCVVTMTNLPWTAALEWTGPNTGIARTKTPTAGGKVVCGLLINCTFTTENATETVTGGENAMKSIEKVKLNRNGGICPATALMSGAGEVLEPKAIYISYVEETL